MKALLQLFLTFFKIGFFTVGGGLAMLPLIQRIAVEDKKWMSEEEMVDCIAVCQSLPGVIAVNAATYIGNRQKGFKGAIASSLGVILPSFIMIILAVLFLNAIGENRFVQGAFIGVKSASCAMILFAAYKLGKQVIKGKFEWVITIASFLIVSVFGVTAIWAIILGAVAGLAAMSYRRIRKSKGKTP